MAGFQLVDGKEQVHVLVALSKRQASWNWPPIFELGIYFSLFQEYQWILCQGYNLQNAE
jgi:hypothetical protein